MEVAERLSLFQDMVKCCHTLYFWTYTKDLVLLESNCPQEKTINFVFNLAGQQSLFLPYVNTHKKPRILSNDLGLMWIIAPQWQEESLDRIHVLGPFYIEDTSTNNLERHIMQYNLSASIRNEMNLFFRSLPVISLGRVFEYAIMLHFCIYGEQIQVSDLHYRHSPKTNGNDHYESVSNLHGTYEAEQEMLRMVREGDLNYRAHMSKLSMTGNLGKLSNGDPIRQIKNTVLVCITLFSRAAIEGGLSSEIALTLTDHYFQSVEACNSMTELGQISHTMQDDFVQRVHRCRTNTDLSAPVQTCMDYIALHLEDEITLSELAKLLGYSEYYLSKKFKKESGKTIKEYLRQKRLERAKFLLQTTQTSAQEIGYRLHFSSQSYFSDSFRKEYGLSPSQWREANRKN